MHAGLMGCGASTEVLGSGFGISRVHRVDGVRRAYRVNRVYRIQNMWGL